MPALRLRRHPVLNGTRCAILAQRNHLLPRSSLRHSGHINLIIRHREHLLNDIRFHCLRSAGHIRSSWTRCCSKTMAMAQPVSVSDAACWIGLGCGCLTNVLTTQTISCPVAHDLFNPGATLEWLLGTIWEMLVWNRDIHGPNGLNRLFDAAKELPGRSTSASKLIVCPTRDGPKTDARHA